MIYFYIWITSVNFIIAFMSISKVRDEPSTNKQDDKILNFINNKNKNNRLHCKNNRL